VDTIGGLSGDKRFMELVNRAGGAAGGEPPVSVPLDQPLAREVGRESYAMANAHWREGYRGAMEEFVGTAASGALKDVVGARDIIKFLGTRESAYHLQCTANWSRDLEVGILSSNVWTNSASVVQVVSNRADEKMTVKKYSHLVMALNVAGSYSAAGSPQSEPIAQPNLVI
jgi:hypothetical protein